MDTNILVLLIIAGILGVVAVVTYIAEITNKTYDRISSWMFLLLYIIIGFIIYLAFGDNNILAPYVIIPMLVWVYNTLGGF